MKELLLLLLLSGQSWYVICEVCFFKKNRLVVQAFQYQLWLHEFKMVGKPCLRLFEKPILCDFSKHGMLVSNHLFSLHFLLLLWKINFPLKINLYHMFCVCAAISKHDYQIWHKNCAEKSRKSMINQSQLQPKKNPSCHNLHGTLIKQ